jgi:hypothetical protein
MPKESLRTLHICQGHQSDGFFFPVLDEAFPETTIDLVCLVDFFYLSTIAKPSVCRSLCMARSTHPTLARFRIT